jgi:hemolysin activation/secretion protein
MRAKFGTLCFLSNTSSVKKINIFLIEVFFILSFLAGNASGQNKADEQEILRQQERQREIRQQMEVNPSISLKISDAAATKLPLDEKPCSTIKKIILQGELHQRFNSFIESANGNDDPAVGRCLGANGIGIVVQRLQQAITRQGYATTRVLVAPQNLETEILTLTIVPGRIRNIRFSDNTQSRATLWNAIPAKQGELLNSRDLEQVLENFKRLPTVEADIQITPSTSSDALQNESDVIIDWNQKLPFRLNISADDSGNKNTGKYLTTATFSYDHWFTLNDLFYVSVIQDAGGGLPGSRGTHGHTVHYSVPWENWLLSATASANSYLQSFAGLNDIITYSGNSDNSELRLGRLLYRNSARKTSASLRLWQRESHNFINDTEITVQRRRTSGWELGLSNRELIGTATLDTTLAYRRGTGALQSLRAPEEARGEGSSRMQIISADAQLNLPFNIQKQTFRYNAGWRAQWNHTPLSPEDKFAIGSRYTVRGFDGELLLSSERGWLLRQEMAWTTPLSGLEMYTGIDTGAVGGRSSTQLVGSRLGGAFIGVRYRQKHCYWDVFIAKPIDKPGAFRTSSSTAGFNVNLSF